MAFRSDFEALVLGILQTEALHGYEIAKRIRNAGGRHLRIGEGQLYPVLHRLEQEGGIEAQWILQDGGPGRKVYRLTECGLGMLAERRKQWERFSADVGAVLSGRPTEPEPQDG